MQTNRPKRPGDHKPYSWDRSDRYFKLEDNWYFTTREGLVMGPFCSKAEAITETKAYIRFIHSVKGPVSAVLKRQKFTQPAV